MTTPRFSPEALAGIADQLDAAEQEVQRLRQALRDVKRIAGLMDLGPRALLVHVQQIAAVALTESPK